MKGKELKIREKTTDVKNTDVKTTDVKNPENVAPDTGASPVVVVEKENHNETVYTDAAQAYDTKSTEKDDVRSDDFSYSSKNNANAYEEFKNPGNGNKNDDETFSQEPRFGNDKTDKASVIFGQSEDEMRREFKAFKAAKLFKKFDCDLTDIVSPEVLDQKLIEVKNYGFGGVVITPQKIKIAKEKLAGTGIEIVAAVCFPLGEEAFGVKKYAIKKAFEKGADRVYVPVGISTVKFNATDVMKREFKKIIRAAKKRKVSAVLESGIMTSAEIEKAVKVLNAAGVRSFVSSSGFFGSGESVSAVKSIRYYLAGGSEICGFTASRKSDEAVGLMSVADRLFVKNAAELAADIKANLKY